MNYKEEAGLNKKSFELHYNGGTIWCEHLDSMSTMEKEIMEKFMEDVKQFSRPSVSAHMIINLDETTISERIRECIIRGIMECPKQFRRIAFVGVDRISRKEFQRLGEKGILVAFLKVFEKAKEWVLG